MSGHALRFGPEYSEALTLADGARVRLRPVKPSDKGAFEAGLMHLSPQSQYLRFFTTKSRFTPSELHYLTDLDGYDHFAIGAARLDEHDNEIEGVGVARFVRLPGEPDVAEPAIAVIDEMHGKGIGKVLMLRLIEAAVERDVKTFRSEFLASNTPMKELLHSLSADTRFKIDGPVVTAEFPLTPEPGDAGTERDVAGPIYAWLKLVAAQSVRLQRVFSLLFDADSVRSAWEQIRRELGFGDDSSTTPPVARPRLPESEKLPD